MVLVLGEEGGEEQNNQSSEIRTLPKVIYRLVKMHHTNTSTVRSCMVRYVSTHTFEQRTNVPSQQARTVLFSKN